MDKLFIKLKDAETVGYNTTTWGQTYVSIVFTDDQDTLITKKSSQYSSNFTWNELFEM